MLLTFGGPRLSTPRQRVNGRYGTRRSRTSVAVVSATGADVLRRARENRDPGTCGGKCAQRGMIVRSPCTGRNVSGVRASLRSVKILRSALKQGSSPADMAHAVSSAWQRTRVGVDPDKWLYIGVDGAA